MITHRSDTLQVPMGDEHTHLPLTYFLDPKHGIHLEWCSSGFCMVDEQLATADYVVLYK